MKIFNKGNRTIGTTEGDLKAKNSIVLNDKEAEKLLAMYPNELDITGATVEEAQEKDNTITELRTQVELLNNTIIEQNDTITELRTQVEDDTIALELEAVKKDLEVANTKIEDLTTENDNLKTDLETEKETNSDLTKNVDKLTKDLEKTINKGQGR